MTDWRELISAQDWETLEDFWIDQPASVCGEILEALRQIVPKVERINGTERALELAAPTEVPQELAGAARILMLGELEAASRRPDGPPTFLQHWSSVSEDARRTCSDLSALPEVTDRAPHMSRGHHAGQVMDLTDMVASVLRAMLASGDEDEEEDELDDLGPSLQEHAATVAVCAFVAGRHFQLALGKDAEPDALRGIKVRDAARRGGESGGRKADDKSAIVIAEMSRILRERPHLTKTRAAELAYRKGHGASAEANRKLWERRGKTWT